MVYSGSGPWNQFSIKYLSFMTFHDCIWYLPTTSSPHPRHTSSHICNSFPVNQSPFISCTLTLSQSVLCISWLFSVFCSAFQVSTLFVSDLPVSSASQKTDLPSVPSSESPSSVYWSPIQPIPDLPSCSGSEPKFRQWVSVWMMSFSRLGTKLPC